MKQFLILIILICTSGCENDINTESNNKSKLIPPSSEFIGFIKKIETKGWVSDTSRINKVHLYNLKGLEIHIFSNYPFYNIPYDKSQVGHVLNGDDDFEKKSKSILSKVKQIWAYYYRKKNETFYIYDGVIEQWVYSDSMDAQSAYTELQSQGDNIYFNTMPFFHRVNNTIFIFHTRAMAFSYEQKELYETFVKTKK